MKTLLLLLSLLLAAPAVPAAVPADATATVSAPDRKDKKAKTETVTYKTTMHCQNCVKKVTDNISFLRGVKDLKVSLDDKLVPISYDPSRTDEKTLAEAIRKLGYEAEKVTPGQV